MRIFPQARSAAFAWLALAGALAGCDDSQSAAAAAAAKRATSEANGAAPNGAAHRLRLDADEAQRAGVQVARLELVDLAETTMVFGTVEANRDRFARIAPPVAGRVVRIGANLGDQVTAGASLAILESAELGEVRAVHHQAQLELGIARANFERSQELVRIGSIAQKDAQRARADLEKAQATLAAAAARLSNLNVGPMAASTTPANALAVVAPFAGTVVEKTAVIGAYAQPYQTLFTIADLGALWIETNLYDRDLADVTVGATATVTVDAYPERRFAGKVTYISSLLDTNTRTVKARVEVTNGDGSLKPGMFANVRIEKETAAKGLRLPDTALVLIHGQMTAFVRRDGGFEPRPVDPGERANGEVTVRAGLAPGEEVVVAGAYALKARMMTALIGGVD